MGTIRETGLLAVLGTPGPTNTLLATAGLRRSLPPIPAEAAGYTVSILALGLLPFGAGRGVRPPCMLGFLLLLASVATAWIAAGAMLGDAAGRRGWDAAVPRIGAAVGGVAVLPLVAPLLHRNPVVPRGGGRELHARPDTP